MCKRVNKRSVAWEFMIAVGQWYLYAPSYVFFFFNDTATTEIYTLSLHDALPIYHSFLQIRLLDRSLGKVVSDLGGGVGRAADFQSAAGTAIQAV